MKNNLKLLCCISCLGRNVLFVTKLTILAFFMGLPGLSASAYSTNTELSLDFNNTFTRTQKYIDEKIENESQQPQRKEISGTVTDVNGALPGVTVVVKGTTNGTITDNDGKFKLSIPVDAKILIFSFIGMKTQEVLIAGKASVNIKLEEQTVAIDDVVVVGYGTQKKVTITGAVSSVGGTQLLQSPVANVSSTLGGRTPGLLVVQRSGEPGVDQSTLRIRGIGTFSGSQEPLVLVDGIESTSMNDIDPNEIENVAILKDASATAVYGVRGANGVVLVTTKRGKISKPQFSLTSNFGITKFTAMRKLMNAYEWASSLDLGYQYQSFATGVFIPKFTAQDLQLFKDGTDPIWHPNVNWFDLAFKDHSTQQQYNLNISGGTDHVKYFISAGYLNQIGLMKNFDYVKDYWDLNPHFKRYNIRTNFDFNVTKNLSLTVNISNVFEEKQGINAPDASGAIRYIQLSNPIGAPGMIDGLFISNPTPLVQGGNPILSIYSMNYSRRYTNYLDGSFRANYLLDQVTKGLSVHGTISYKNYNFQNTYYWKGYDSYTAIKQADNTTKIVQSGFAGSTGGGTLETNKNRMTYSEFGFDYSRTFGDHSFTCLLLYNQTKFFDPGLQYVIPRGYQGLVGRAGYSYKSRYMGEFDFGYNGTENFAPGKRFGFFPAASLGWILSEEPFFPKNNIISFIKLRGSYGEVGNDKIGNDRFLYRPNSYSYNSGAYFFGLAGTSSFSYTGAMEGKIGNPDVTWERAKKSDIGVDLTLFNDHIKVTADVFREMRDNILTTRNTIPFYVGGGSNLPVVNIGSMRNQGYDGEISYNNKIGDFFYRLGFNMSYAVNRVLFQDEVRQLWDYQYRTGQRSGQIFGNVGQGFYNSWEEVNPAYRAKVNSSNDFVQPGDQHWRDVNGDGIVDGYDSAPVGTTEFPEKVFGFTGSFTYKKWDLNFLFQGATNVVFSASGEYYMVANQDRDAGAAYLLNRWSLENYQNGNPIYFPRQTPGSGLSGSNAVVDASYIRLRSLEISYSLEKVGVLKLLGLNSTRIYLNGSNLLTWAPAMHKMFPGVDPENIGAYGNNEPYPRTSVFNLGVNIKF